MMKEFIELIRFLTVLKRRQEFKNVAQKTHK